MDNRNRTIKGVSILAALLLFVLIPTIRLALFAVTASKPGSAESEIIEISKGLNPNELTKILLSHEIISDGKYFNWLGKLGRQWRKIKAGEYQFSPSMTPIEVFSVLTSGVSIAHPVTVREGENMYEIADDLAAKNLVNRDSFLVLCKDPRFIASLGLFKDHTPSTLEGYFFPDTYFFNRTMSQADIAKQMVKHFFEFWSKTQEARANELKMSRHEIITLASIIEKETGASEERPLISSIFHNRLRKRMKLQSDPTTIYGMWDHYEGKIHKKDLSAKNEYNTYYIDALPIGPIGNPGKEAIEAALHPVESAYLYFVSHNDGTHQFSKTFEEHNRAVRKYQLDPKARAGKSWRDHLKKPASISP